MSLVRSVFGTGTKVMLFPQIVWVASAELSDGQDRFGLSSSFKFLRVGIFGFFFVVFFPNKELEIQRGEDASPRSHSISW